MWLRAAALCSARKRRQYIYSRAFTSPFQLGYASAIATVLFVIIMVMSLALNTLFLKREEAIYQ